MVADELPDPVGEPVDELRQIALRLAGAPGAVFLRIGRCVAEMSPGEALAFAERVAEMARRAIAAGQREPRNRP